MSNIGSAESSGDALQRYIAVGVLRKRNLPPHAESQRDDDADDGFPMVEIESLEKHRWIQTRTYPHPYDQRWGYVQVWVLPEDTSRGLIPRSSQMLKRALRLVLSKVDRSAEAWARPWSLEVSATNVMAPAEDESLWYIFNTLQNPDPDPETIRDPYAKQAMQDLLFHADETIPAQDRLCMRELKTPLHPYQRRSAATMVQREVQPAQMLDPRLQVYRSPTGQEYYFDKEEGTLVREKRLYSEACGGILAETMGCGKTLICLALILATRGHFPQIPMEYLEPRKPVRRTTGSLLQMTAAAAGRFSLPWKRHFQILHEAGSSYERCVKACEESCGAYTIYPPQPMFPRSNSPYPRPPPKTIRLCAGTLVVVPNNLVDHWKREIANHTDGLRVLVLQNNSETTPPPDELLKYDIILFSRTRFEKEAGQSNKNRRSHTVDEVSPLTWLHWLRIIVDEGHDVAGHGHRTNMVHILDQLHIERRWIVSGTPTSGLYGVEVSLTSQETNMSDSDVPGATSIMLDHRKKTGNAVVSELKDLDKLRLIAVDFLKLKPWSNPRGGDTANWTKYIKPIGEDRQRRKAPSLRATLQSLVVRHRLDVINAEISLPRLHNNVVYLEPTFYDKLSINIFLFGLAVNAITSERRDRDYMFHSRNRKHLSQLISNLRQAGFWWAGSEADLKATVDFALKYMENNQDRMSEADVGMLTEGVVIAQMAISSAAHNAFAQFHELGVFVQHFPAHAREMWALDSSQTPDGPLLLGISQARVAQKFVTSHLNSSDPAEGLAGAGIKARRETTERAVDTKTSSDAGKPETGIQNSKVELLHKPQPDRNETSKKSFEKGLFKTLPPESPLAQTRLIGTASAKLSYLLERVLEFYKTEKIIIFYDNNNTAYWIAEGLEMLGVDFRIYANSLKTSERTAYLWLFNESEEVRVLLMDLRQASHGLHIASASRVFIVNPIWQPNVESQAIKRAHRVGQIRPVFVETLVLKDTLEDKMLRRRKEMSESEMQQAEKDLLDDTAMSSIIQNEPFIPMLNDEAFAGIAFLEEPIGFFDRYKLPILDDEDGDASNCSPIRRKTLAFPGKRKRVTIVDATTEDPSAVVPSDSDAKDASGSKRSKVTSSVRFATANNQIESIGQSAGQIYMQLQGPSSVGTHQSCRQAGDLGIDSARRTVLVGGAREFEQRPMS